MDEKYFEEKYFEGMGEKIIKSYHGLGELGIDEILQEIFLDGCKKQAGNSVEAMIRFMDKCHKDNPTGMFLIASGKDLIDALTAAEIKSCEVK